MRLVGYGGAMSLDGYIAGPNGEYDWIVMDPEIDFAGMMRQFDTYLIGRKTFEAMRRMAHDAKFARAFRRSCSLARCDRPTTLT
jgi:dihydrofolate reductase